MPLSEYRHIISNLHSIIRLSSHYQLTPYHYHSIAILSEVYMPLSENRHIIGRLYVIIRVSSHYQQVSMSLSEYRHIISRLHAIIWISSHQLNVQLIIRVSSHYQQTPPYYQDIETLLADSTSLLEYRHIISTISIFIIITIQLSFCIYTIIFFYSLQYTLYPLFSPPTCTSSSLLTSACHNLVFPVINMFLFSICSDQSSNVNIKEIQRISVWDFRPL